MKRRATILALALLAAVGAGAQAITTFTPNTSISAADMNGNFTALKDALIALTARVATLETQVTTINDANTIAGNSTSGYATLDGGLILEWGAFTAASYLNGTQTVVTLPMPFPSACLYASAGLSVPSTDPAIAGSSSWSVRAMTTTNVTFERTNYSNITGESRFIWFAIGH